MRFSRCFRTFHACVRAFLSGEGTMCIVTNYDGNSWKYGRRLKMIAGAAGLASAVFLSKPALGYNIQLPEIGTTVYNVTVANSNIDGGAVAEADNASFNNTTVINDFLA